MNSVSRGNNTHVVGVYALFIDMHGAAVLAAGVTDALAGTLLFTHGGHWDRVKLGLADFSSPVQIADLWLVFPMKFSP
jgi:hypothetical protein